jgi:hypothetical protein
VSLVREKLRPPRDELDKLGAKIRHAILTIEADTQDAARLLLQAREKVAHGEWIPWLRSQKISVSTAERLIREFKHPAIQAERKLYQLEKNAAAKARRAQRQPTPTPTDDEPPPADNKISMHGDSETESGDTKVADLDTERKRKSIVDFLKAATSEQVEKIYNLVREWAQ